MSSDKRISASSSISSRGCHGFGAMASNGSIVIAPDNGPDGSGSPSCGTPASIALRSHSCQCSMPSASAFLTTKRDTPTSLPICWCVRPPSANISHMRTLRAAFSIFFLSASACPARRFTSDTIAFPPLCVVPACLLLCTKHVLRVCLHLFTIFH